MTCSHVYKEGLDPGINQILESIQEDSLLQHSSVKVDSPTESFLDLYSQKKLASTKLQTHCCYYFRGGSVPCKIFTAIIRSVSFRLTAISRVLYVLHAIDFSNARVKHKILSPM